MREMEGRKYVAMAQLPGATLIITLQPADVLTGSGQKLAGVIIRSDRSFA